MLDLVRVVCDGGENAEADDLRGLVRLVEGREARIYYPYLMGSTCKKVATVTRVKPRKKRSLRSVEVNFHPLFYFARGNHPPKRSACPTCGSSMR